MTTKTKLTIPLISTTIFLATPTQAKTKNLKNTKPNIVVILADDLGWRDVGFVNDGGHELYETPNLDRIAQGGMIFTHAYACAGNSSPSRASLMTGTYSPRHQIYTPGGKSKGDVKYMKLKVPTREQGKDFNTFYSSNSTLSPTWTSLAEVLKPAGYVSARFGKWHLGTDNQGFDEFGANGVQGVSNSYYGDTTAGLQITQAAINFIDRNKEKPFFLYLPYWEVHIALNARMAGVNKYKKKLAAITQPSFNWDPTYAAMIQQLDDYVGEVYQKLEKEGLLENTILIFSSDNGDLR